MVSLLLIPLATSRICVPLLHPKSYHAMLVVDVVVHRHHDWVGLLAEFLLSLSGALWNHEREPLWSLSSGTPGPFVWSLWCLQQQRFASHLWQAIVGNSNWLFVWGNLTTQKRSSHVWLRGVVRWPLALGESTIGPEEKSSLKFSVIHTHTICFSNFLVLFQTYLL